MYKIKPSKSFLKSAKKLIKQKRITVDRLDSVVKRLAEDPFENGLKTHKVNSRIKGLQYSSRVDGDLRIIWNFDKNENLVIILLDLGGHSGNKAVY